MKKTGIELITEERKEQIEKHGRTIESDIKNNSQSQLSIAAKTLRMRDLGKQSMSFLMSCCPIGWNDRAWIKMCIKPRFKRLIIAGALMDAEIDRLKISGKLIADEIDQLQKT